MQMKKISIFILILLAAISFWYFTQKKEDTKPTSSQKQTSQTDSPHVISTKPDPLEDNIVGASDPVEITFNRSIENTGEFKLKIEPKIDFSVTLSSDRKTATISFLKP